jgi:hypothetical protein
MAAVLLRWMNSSSSAVASVFFSASRSSIWPPMRRSAAGGVGQLANERVGEDGAAGIVLGQQSWKAWVSRASPASNAVASSNCRCAVGRPRRRSSLSMHGRSSWISE